MAVTPSTGGPPVLAFGGSSPFGPIPDSATSPSELWKAFVTAVRMGWKMEANWTDPVLFLIYSVAKPVSSALILIVMLQVVAGAGAAALQPFVVIGTALWSLVQSGISGLAWSILDDRERYRMLKYIYVSPSEFVIVLLGRGVARLGAGFAGAFITIALGIVALGVRIDPSAVDWPLLVVAMLGGVASIVALALVMAAICLQTRQESWSYPEAFSGALFLVSAAVFPLAILPTPLQVIGLVSPISWWIEGVRLALDPGMPSGIGGTGSLLLGWLGRAPAPLEIVLALLVTGAVGTLAAAITFRGSARRARDRGLLDVTTGS